MQLTFRNYDHNSSSRRSFSDSFFNGLFNSEQRIEKCSNFPSIQERFIDRMLGEMESPLKGIISNFNDTIRKTDLDGKSIFEISMPGRDKTDFTIEVIPQGQRRNIILQVKAKSQKQKDDVSQGGYVSKFAQEDMSFCIALPAKYNFDMATSFYENGVLKIEVPFLEEQKSSIKLIPII